MRDRKCYGPRRQRASGLKNRDIDVRSEGTRSKYGISSRITAIIADYAEEEKQPFLYQEALRQAKAEGDAENEQLILDSLAEIRNEQKA